MYWIAFVLFGQFLNALVVLLDKHIVSAKIVSKPIVYTFYVNLLSIIAIFALPFGVASPSLETLCYSVLAGVAFAISIFLLYRSLTHSDPSDTIPVIGGVSAITTFVASYFFLDQALPHNFLIGFFILVLGMVLISHFKFDRKAIYELTGSGLFFGLSTVLVKMVFMNETFVNGFFWTRMANVLIAVLILLIPGAYRSIRGDKEHSGVTRRGKKRKLSSKVFFILGNKALAGVSFFFILMAIKHGDIALVNALAAAQYVFLFIFAILWRNSFPDYFSSKKYKHELIHKISAIALICIGFLILFI